MKRAGIRLKMAKWYLKMIRKMSVLAARKQFDESTPKAMSSMKVCLLEAVKEDGMMVRAMTSTAI